MDNNRKVSVPFRKRLRAELDIWRAESIVSDEQATKLSDRYALDDLKSETNDFSLSIYVLGALLICGGAVSFVAAHWDEMGKWYKVALIVGAMCALNITGFVLWKVSQTRPMLGHGLIILGTLMLGANIGLLAQIFHISGDWYSIYGAWAIGALVMAWAVQSTLTGLIALVLSFIWYCGWIDCFEHSFCYYPFVVAGLFVPLAYKRSSELLFGAVLLAIWLSVGISAVAGTRWLGAWSLVATGIGLLFFAWALISSRSKRFAHFAAPAGALGILAIVFGAFPVSFRNMASDLTFDATVYDKGWWLIPTGTAYLAGALMWVLSWRKALSRTAYRPLTIAVLAASVLCLLAIFIGGITTIVAANLALVILSAGLVCSGVTSLDRRVFWSGILLCAVVIIARFLEYDTNLMVKSAGFLACGAGMIFSGIRFDSYLRRRELAHEEV